MSIIATKALELARDLREVPPGYTAHPGIPAARMSAIDDRLLRLADLAETRLPRAARALRDYARTKGSLSSADAMELAAVVTEIATLAADPPGRT